uniref:Formimidoyltransferase-cyclodeaminase n=1 Tax=Sinocyclocheilus anshuiensis TaxID=1608454 RepID=A0A671SCK7_9TELE
ALIVLECIFSEIFSSESILATLAIADAMSATEGCSLLDVNPGSSTNRTVYAFVGPPAAVIEGVLNAGRVAFKLIDMTKHSGTAVEAVAECVQCANEFVYLYYGEAARKESRRSLLSIRAGNTNEWTPEYGPATFVPSWGATVTGARKFLIAYNVNLLSTKEHAHRIALDIREQGRGKDQICLKVQGIGWYLEEANLAQVSTNILDFEVMPVHMVYEEICKDARDLNLPVVGSQIVGLIPLKAMLDCADFYIQKEKLFIVEEEHKIRLVISKLRLDSSGPFVPKERIIVYGMGDNGRLASLSLQKFVHGVGARTAAPGGGSVSAAIAAMSLGYICSNSAALGCMVGQMTYGKRQFESQDAEMRKLIPPFHEAMNDSLLKVDADSMAFNSYMIQDQTQTAALKLPKGTPDEIKRREEAMQEGLKVALGVPLSLAEIINKLWPALKEMVKYGNVFLWFVDFQTVAKVSVLLKNARENANIVLEMADQRKLSRLY